MACHENFVVQFFLLYKFVLRSTKSFFVNKFVLRSTKFITFKFVLNKFCGTKMGISKEIPGDVGASRLPCFTYSPLQTPDGSCSDCRCYGQTLAALPRREKSIIIILQLFPRWSKIPFCAGVLTSPLRISSASKSLEVDGVLVQTQ